MPIYWSYINVCNRLRMPINEALINGVRQHYDACSVKDLETAKNFYANYDYIGSGYTTYHNGVKNNWAKLHHFFIKNKKSPVGKQGIQ